MLLTWDPTEILVEGADVDSGAGVTQHTGGKVFEHIEALLVVQRGATEMPLLRCIKGTSCSSRQKKETADIKHLWGIFSKSRQTKIKIYSIQQRADNLLDQ